MPDLDKVQEHLSEFILGLSGRQTITKQVQNCRISLNARICQGHEPVAYIAHSRHIKGLPQGGRTASGIKRSEDVDGVIREVNEPLTRGPQGTSSTEKQHPGTQLRILPDPGHFKTLRTAIFIV
jgi:hypothetical protein